MGSRRFPRCRGRSQCDDLPQQDAKAVHVRLDRSPATVSSRSLDDTSYSWQERAITECTEFASHGQP